MRETDVLDLLRHPEGRDWSLQGFGLLRLYLDNSHTLRLHIWDTEAEALDEVTRVHDHPWDLDSRIISGHLTNQRYLNEPTGTPSWESHLIRPGGDAALLSPKQPCSLTALEPEFYVPGDTYHQDAPEIHESQPSRGAVTLASRTNRLERDEATVFTREGGCWVDAAPRPAQPDEVLRMTRLALKNWQTNPS